MRRVIIKLTTSGLWDLRAANCATDYSSDGVANDGADGSATAATDIGTNSCADTRTSFKFADTIRSIESAHITAHEPAFSGYG